MAFAPSFLRWLSHQQYRDDPVGSLARFARDEIELTREVGPAELQALLTWSHAPERLRATVDSAIHEWADEAGRISTLAAEPPVESRPTAKQRS
jgi:hypothetical protein